MDTRLVNEGNTVIEIAHNLDVIKTADHVIDPGPVNDGAGGEDCRNDHPPMLCEVAQNHTGRAMRAVMG